jgi:hypothetical protein
VVAVSFDAGVSQACLHDQVHVIRYRSDVGKVFSTHKKSTSARLEIALVNHGPIDNALKDAFAVLVAGSSVAELQSGECGIESGV